MRVVLCAVALLVSVAFGGCGKWVKRLVTEAQQIQADSPYLPLHPLLPLRRQVGVQVQEEVEAAKALTIDQVPAAQGR